MIMIASSYLHKLTARHLYMSKLRSNTRLFSDSFSGSYTSLYEELRTWRNSLAEELQRQPYHIVKNKVLEELCKSLPRTPQELYNVPGVGPKTMTYGDKILDIIDKYIPEKDNITTDKINDSVEENLTSSGESEAWWSTNAPSSSSRREYSTSTTTNSQNNTIKTTAITGNKKLVPESVTSCTEFIENIEKSKPKPRGRRKKDIPYVPPPPGFKPYPAVHGIHHRVTLESLTNEQKYAAQEVLKGRNIFLTGSAGTGKSHVLKYIIQELQKKHGVNGVAITAPTGVAAINVGGQTLHSFAGIGLGKGRQDTLVSKVLRSRPAVERWENARVLIIDEISMLDMDLFNTIDNVARRVRYRPDEPFGGLQVVCVGDFFQLPPVVGGADKHFCFESLAWEELGLREVDSKIILHEVVRQSESNFISLLNDVRIGAVNPDLLRQLDEHLISRKPQPADGIVPTRLYCTNRDVDKENTDRLRALDSPLETFTAQDVWKSKPTGASVRRFILDAIEKSTPSTIELKVGAQVMLLRNRSVGAGGKQSDRGLVNGSRGVVVAFTESAEGGDRGQVPVVRFDDGQTIVVGYVETLQSGVGGDGILARSQLPLKLAWAVTVHKSQGSTLSRAVLEIASAFDYGQAYVALSRVSSLEGLWLSRPITEQSIKVHPKVLRYYGLDRSGRPLNNNNNNNNNLNYNNNGVNGVTNGGSNIGRISEADYEVANRNVANLERYLDSSSISSGPRVIPSRRDVDIDVNLNEKGTETSRKYAYGEYDMAGEDSFDEHLG